MKYFIFSFLLMLTFFSCGGNDFPKADNALVGSQSFLQAALRGDFKQANFYLLQDSANKAKLEDLKKVYYQYSSDQRVEYRSSNIIVGKDSIIDANNEIISCKNSYDKKDCKIKMVNTNGNWQVDLKNSEGIGK